MEMSVIKGVPGCGKTTQLLETFKNNEDVLIVV